MGILKKILKSKVFAVTATALSASAFITTPALAQDLSPVTAMLTTIGTALVGPLGRAAGLVALAACGFAFMTGRMNWQLAGSIVIGLVILFGAATILAGF